jgi:hypothetical protein
MRNLAWASLLAFALALAPGCSTHKETTVTTTETTGYPSDTVVQKSETTTTDTSSSKSGGVLSSTVDVVGDVIALPFKAVGSLLGAIF